MNKYYEELHYDDLHDEAFDYAIESLKGSGCQVCQSKNASLTHGPATWIGCGNLKWKSHIWVNCPDCNFAEGQDNTFPTYPFFEEMDFDE